MRYILICLGFLFCSAAWAGDSQPSEAEAPSPPPIPDPLPPKIQDSDEQIEPQVVIRREDDRIVEEYSSNGQVYMIKVTPIKGGPSWYLIDTDGTGTLEPLAPHMQPVVPAHWKIAEW